MVAVVRENRFCLFSPSLLHHCPGPMIQEPYFLFARYVAAVRQQFEFLPFLQRAVNAAAQFHRLDAGALLRREVFKFIESFDVNAQLEPANRGGVGLFLIAEIPYSSEREIMR